MIRVVLADDEPLAIRGLTRLLDGIADVQIVGTAATGSEALSVIRACEPDLVFLDIRMPVSNGIEVAAALVGARAPDIVFVTAFDSFAVDAFSLDAVDYILKPVQADRLLQSLQRARRRMSERHVSSAAAPATPKSSLYVPDRHGGTHVPQDEIVWIQAAKDYGLIHTERRSFILRSTMSDLAALLDDEIVRVHRSAFAALSKIEKVRASEKGAITLVLKDGIEINVGPSYTKEVRELLRGGKKPSF